MMIYDRILTARIIFFCALFFSTSAYAADSPNIGPVEILQAQGKVLYRVSAMDLWKPAGSGVQLKTEGEISTGPNGFCLLGMGYRSRNVIRLSENTHMLVKSIDPPALGMREGKTMVWLRDLKADSSFQLATPTAVAAARGTGWSQTPSQIICFEGAVHVKGISGKEADLVENQGVAVSSDGTLGKMAPAKPDSVLDWQSFARAVHTQDGSEDFVFVKNEESGAVLKFYTQLERKEYRTTEIDEKEYQVRVNREYEPVDKESITLEKGLIKKVDIIYADLSGPGSRNIAEIRILTKVSVRFEESDTFYGLRFDLKDKFGTLREEENDQMPPPLPEPANEAAVRGPDQTAASPKSITSWNQVNASGFGSANNTDIPAMSEFRGFLYAGTVNAAAGAKLFRSSNGGAFENVDLTGMAGFAGNVAIKSMTVYPVPESASTRLYLGSAQDTASGVAGSVFVTSDGTSFSDLTAGGKWSVANDGANDSPSVSALIVYANYLYAAVSFQRFNAEIWRRPVNDDAVVWEKVLSKAQMTAITGSSRDAIIHEFKIFNNKLYAAIENTAGTGEGPVVLVSTSGDSGSWLQAGPRGL